MFLAVSLAAAIFQAACSILLLFWNIAWVYDEHQSLFLLKPEKEGRKWVVVFK